MKQPLADFSVWFGPQGKSFRIFEISSCLKNLRFFFLIFDFGFVFAARHPRYLCAPLHQGVCIISCTYVINIIKDYSEIPWSYNFTKQHLFCLCFFAIQFVGFISIQNSNSESFNYRNIKRACRFSCIVLKTSRHYCKSTFSDMI